MNVILAEDSVLLRAGIARLLTDAGMTIVAEADDGEMALAAVELHQPDIVVMDVRMPPTHTDEGIRAALTIRRRFPQISVLVLSQYVEQYYASELLAGDNAGSVKISLLAPPTNVDLSSSAGSTTLELPRTSDAYDVDASSTAGSSTVTVDTSTSSARKIRVRSSAGSVKVTYSAAAG
jgi:DNA-binding NarL/FixJ family response regulator